MIKFAQNTPKSIHKYQAFLFKKCFLSNLKKNLPREPLLTMKRKENNKSDRFKLVVRDRIDCMRHGDPIHAISVT